jgi:GNAT superfamily N-acetyltransferase
MTIVIQKGYLPGCIGRVTELHAKYYSKLVGFGMPFESKVARELAEFCGRYDEQRDGLWLASNADGIRGSIAIDGIHARDEGAHLRWFITASEVSGTGIGNSLLSSAVEFCRERAYERIHLWTFDGLGAARHLYEKFGFRLVQERRGSQWGAYVDEQRFELRV